MVAVQMVLEATRHRLGSYRLQRAEHRRLTETVLGGTPEQIQATLTEWEAKNGSKMVAKVTGLPDTGPMWIPGAAPPPVSHAAFSK